MPKKTRKEKIIAEYHRRLATLQPKSTPDNVTSIPLPARASTTFRPTLETVVYPQLTVIKKDLIKTLVLSAVAITVELILSWRFS
ncbi:MAG: hypothetical protein ACOY0S_00375 [Patescibacteria group bacterium]